jgi:sarcosine oxidase gamma subunit
MGLHLPRIGRFTETDGLLLARAEPYRVTALRNARGVTLRAELAPLGSLATLLDEPEGGLGVRLSGLGVATRLRLLLPLDLHPERFGSGRCARVEVAHLSIVVLRHRLEEFELQCGHAYADSFFRSIEAAMAAIIA